MNIRISGGLITSMRWGQFVPALALILIGLHPSPSSAAIYKCTAQDGGITYTDEPCAPDAKTQTIDPAKPTWLLESSPTVDTIPAVVDEKLQSQPEVLAALCAADEFHFWLKVQRGPLPERDIRTAKLIRFGKLCRSALHLPSFTAAVADSPPKPVPTNANLLDSTSR